MAKRERHGWRWGKYRETHFGPVRYVANEPGAWKPESVNETGTDAASELRDRWELLGLVLKAKGVV